MKETDEIMGMIKEEGVAYFERERGNKVEVGLYLEHICFSMDIISEFILLISILLLAVSILS